MAVARSIEELGSYIRELRVERGLRQEDLAEWLGLEKTAVSKLENGQRGLAVSELAELAERFAVSLDDLLFDDAEEHILMRTDDEEKGREAIDYTDRLIEDMLYLRALTGAS